MQTLLGLMETSTRTHSSSVRLRCLTVQSLGDSHAIATSTGLAFMEGSADQLVCVGSRCVTSWESLGTLN